MSLSAACQERSNTLQARKDTAVDQFIRNGMFEDSPDTTHPGIDCVTTPAKYAYTESDEISLLFDPDEQLFGRKLRKYNSTLAGEASAQLSIRLGQVATLDCRISQLPTPELVVDYFRWRNEDAARNALSAWCYWTLRKDGQNEQQATKRMLGMSVGQRNELLFQYGINFNDLPNWQKRGVGLYWEEYDKLSANPITNEDVMARRRRICTDFDLPMKNEYGQFVRSLISQPQIQGA